jgi:hypothetical protein
MNRTKLFLAVLGILLLAGMTACSPKNRGTQAATELPAAATTPLEATLAVSTSSEPQLSATPTVDGNALILEKLQNHHDSDRIFTANKTREEWNATLDRMIGYGAKISEEEKQIIIDYLLSR